MLNDAYLLKNWGVFDVVSETLNNFNLQTNFDFEYNRRFHIVKIYFYKKVFKGTLRTSFKNILKEIFSISKMKFIFLKTRELTVACWFYKSER